MSAIENFFTGGKMFHVFSYPRGEYTYDGGFASDEAKDAFLNGTFLHKIDGSNHILVHRADGGWDVYQRYDDKRWIIDPNDLPYDMISLQKGGNPDVMMDDEGNRVTRHYYYKKVVIPEPKIDKKSGEAKYGVQAKMFIALYAIVEDKKDVLDRIAAGRSHVTFEAVGKKFNKTPGVDTDVDIAIHSEQVIDYKDERTFDGIKKYLLEDVCCEGIIVAYKGKCWKIRVTCFDKENAFDKIAKDGAPKNLLLPICLSSQE